MATLACARVKSGDPHMTVTVDEQESAIYTAVLQDVTGAFPSLTALELTLYERTTGAVITGRDNQNVLNANSVTYKPGYGAGGLGATRVRQRLCDAGWVID
jgi:hypothetical protein